MKKSICILSLILISAAAGQSRLYAEDSSFPYYTLGLSAGTPSLINAHAGIYGERFGAQLTMSALQAALLYDRKSTVTTEFRGFWGQFNIDYALLSSESFLFSLSPLCGMGYYKDDDLHMSWYYAGGAVHFRLLGFFTELGAAYGPSDNYPGLTLFGKTRLIWQVGYMWRFS